VAKLPKPRTIKPRIKPLPKKQWTDDQREVFAFWGEPNAWEEGSKTNIISVMGVNPALGKVYNVWGKHFLMSNSIPLRELELIILRVAWKVRSEYEWHNHVGYGLNAGLKLEEITELREKIDPAKWSEHDAALLRAVDEMIAKGNIGNKTWKVLLKTYSKPQMMDLIFSIGHYVMTSWALSAMGVQLESPDPIGWDLRHASGKIPGKSYKPGETEDWIDTRGY
jgi:4-carboxymuconolactone decarboxylase